MIVASWATAALSVSVAVEPEIATEDAVADVPPIVNAVVTGTEDVSNARSNVIASAVPLTVAEVGRGLPSALLVTD